MVLTERQQAILDFIVGYQAENGCTPSIPEMQREFGIRSPNGVAGHLKALEKKGLIARANRASRRIEPLGPDGTRRGAVCDLPLHGSIPAGHPHAAVQSAAAERMIAVDQSTLGFKPRPGSYVLKVTGDSMKDAAILDGDLVVIEPEPNPRPGQIVAALIDGESTLKRLLRLNGRYILRAENERYPDYHPKNDLEIQGVARTVIRKLT